MNCVVLIKNDIKNKIINEKKSLKTSIQILLKSVKSNQYLIIIPRIEFTYYMCSDYFVLQAIYLFTLLGILVVITIFFNFFIHHLIKNSKMSKVSFLKPH